MTISREGFRMESYSIWQDFFATYRSSPDTIKALWLIVPPAFVIALVWVVLKASSRDRNHVATSRLRLKVVPTKTSKF